jgi:hypothetical protein
MLGERNPIASQEPFQVTGKASYGLIVTARAILIAAA